MAPPDLVHRCLYTILGTFYGFRRRSVGVGSNGAAKRGKEVYRTKLPAVVVHDLRLKRAMCLSRPTSEPGKLPYARSKGRTDEARGKDACHDRLLGLMVRVARLSVALVVLAVW